MSWTNQSQAFGGFGGIKLTYTARPELVEGRGARKYDRTKHN